MPVLWILLALVSNVAFAALEPGSPFQLDALSDFVH